MRRWAWLAMAALGASALALGLPAATGQGVDPMRSAPPRIEAAAVAAGPEATRTEVADLGQVVRAQPVRAERAGVVHELERHRTAMAAAVLYLMAGDAEGRFAP